MAKQALVIVESPGKVSSIAKYLGDGYVVEASRGHVRDLPATASEIPAKYKDEKWARTGVNVDAGFAPLYVVNPDKRQTIRKLKDELKNADELLLATDGDREGEAIAWHLLQELKPTVPVKRMEFHEITSDAIRHAVSHPRDLDLDLVNAQETRRILDRLYGYEVSPVLWKKVMPKLSAGRVQSVATRLIVDRERERMAFVSAPYWDIEAILDAGPGGAVRQFPARVATVDAIKLAQGPDFDSRGRLKNDKAVQVGAADARLLAEVLEGAAYQVASVESKPYTRRPYAPFRTTTLQQEAGRKLGFTSQRTMSVAQELYEGGYITYMRTDSITLSSQAIDAARAQVADLYGTDYLPDKPRVYTSKVKNAQEAHEAIRPAGDHFRTPAQTGLTGDTFRLYELIWKRTLASQMADAKGETVTIKINGVPHSPISLSCVPSPVSVVGLVAGGRTITFPGFLKAYVETLDDPDAAGDDDQLNLPSVREGQSLDAVRVSENPHATKPQARYTEPTLVAKLEELEIGRPSTYASIIRTITARDYVYKKGAALVPTWLAFAVTRLLAEHFPKLIDYQFTADMEDVLDEIAKGNADRLKVLGDFYFGTDAGDSPGLRDLVGNLGDIDARELSTFPIGDVGSGVEVRVGRYGAYIEDGTGRRANLPEDLPPDELTVELAHELLDKSGTGERELGLDPDTHLPIVAKDGRFGPYVTELLGDDAPKSAKPRTASLFATMSLDTVTLDDALKLLSLPRVVGTDADGAQITAQNGRYGPYLKKGSDSRSLDSEEQLFTITLDQAAQIFAEPKRRGRAAASPLRELGVDANTGKPVVIKNGRFGPYVTDGEYNATLRVGDTVEEITLERASELLAEKRAKGPAKRATKKTPAKKTATKKTPATKALSAKTAKTTTSATSMRRTATTKAAASATQKTDAS